MEIISTNIDRANKVDIYRLTKASSVMVQEAPEGLSVPISKWCMYNDPKEQKDGTMKENKVLSFVDNAGVKYSTVSATFIREFEAIVEIMDPDPFAIILRHGTTKSGKPFVTCELDCNYQA